MRIVSGIYGGRRLVAPKGDVARPTQDRVREAWFSILGAEVQDARVLDLFAGSGALGLEALSRGAASVFADPPYDIGAGPKLVALFRARPFCRILSIEHRATEKLDGDDTRRYGDSAVTFLYNLTP
ncbi:MAG: RsmD family RNA methyltransferase [Gemmatimonadetes bacterium]|nr:RsmD family RNA methyltransferase [Gemmatimonadota bacterium]